MSTTTKILATLALAVSAVGLTGCAAEAEQPTGAQNEATSKPEVGEPKESEQSSLRAESGDTYLKFQDHIVPNLLRVVVDGPDVTYDEISCLGKSSRVLTGSLVESDEIAWDVENPDQGTPGLTSAVEITPKKLALANGDVYTPQVESAQSQFVDACKATGEDIGELLLG